MSMNTEQKRICFIDSEYNLLFTIPDGSSIRITFTDGLNVTRECRYIDDYHAKIGSTVYHICEFAERMEQNGSRYAPTEPLTLPDLCYSVLPSSGELVMLKKGEAGYFSCAYNSDSEYHNRRQLKHLNERLQVTPPQCAAMEAGSMFGWNVPAADPNRYDMRGTPLPEHDPAKEITYTIYQLKDTPDTWEYRFIPLQRLCENDLSVTSEHYEPVYTETIRPTEQPTDQTLMSSLFYRFNVDTPAGFAGHSLSISDIVTIRRNETVRAYYVDSVGFAELSGFLPPENALKNAEMAMEDDYGMIDGIINNGESPARKSLEKASIQEALQKAKPERGQAIQNKKTNRAPER